ncbi:mRNA-decapping enzyme-like protein [Cajanus cajan]|uniref:mRNA-decapping enzyme-like protein n=1 Tax=Cajanus cajan TaxID=3821 RepID=A0A151S1B1_CAJCA|nr:mRNA-decapping enzyme-like protein [Cajanus cajan]KYP48601.1 mRNA-decapping enzyme-like protein [Cajanus cajan]
MSQTKKLTPNLDQQSTKVLNLTVLQRIDPFIDEILFTAAHVSFYDFNIESNQWSRKDVEGSLFVVKRNSQPRFQFIVMNRRNTDNLVENLLDFEYELKNPYLLYRNAAQEVNGIWFYNPDECEEVANLFNRILNAYPKAPPTTIMPANKSEFEELQPVSTIPESPLESSSAASATDAVEDSVFTNFFSTSNIAGKYASNVENFRQHSATITSTAPSSLLSPAPTMQKIPSASHSTSSISGFPLDSLETIKSGHQVLNLVKPSTFLASTSSSLLVPPISSSVPPSAVVHHSLNLPHQYGTPVLQPFPPSNPPLSLTPPISNSTPDRPVVSRDKVRDALLSLVQDDQFIDMMFQALLKVNY